MSKPAQSIQLPAAVLRRVHRAAKRINKNPSDVAAEALEWYFRVCSLPEETPTAAESRAIRRGRDAFQKGDYVSFDEFRRREALVRRPRRACPKSS